MESVVQSGHLSREKVVQIRAHDRVLTAAAIRGQAQGGAPAGGEAYHRGPQGYQGQPARDAFRIVMAHFAGS